jgi:hypothetical protein
MLRFVEPFPTCFTVRENFPRAASDAKVPLTMNENTPASQEPSYLQRTTLGSNDGFADLEVGFAELKSEERTVSRFYVPTGPSIDSAENFLKIDAIRVWRSLTTQLLLIQLIP